MAGDWLKVEKATPFKPEILSVAAKLGMEPDAVFGKCFRLWCWADDHTTNGDAPVTQLSSIDALIQRTGFAQALLEVGWLELHESGVRFPNFERHMGQSAKRRALTQKRTSEYRKRSRDAPVTPNASPEKRREENIYNPPLPPLLEGPEFKKTWGDWVAYRKQKGQKLTKIGVARQIKFLSELPSVQAAIASLEQSMTNGWTGLFEPRENQNGTGRTMGQSSRVRAEPGKYAGIGTTINCETGGQDGANGNGHA